MPRVSRQGNIENSENDAVRILSYSPTERAEDAYLFGYTL